LEDFFNQHKKLAILLIKEKIIFWLIMQKQGEDVTNTHKISIMEYDQTRQHWLT
jgi:hypothetical protein